jgi:hypothetical protein
MFTTATPASTAFFTTPDERLRIGRRQDNGVHPARDHLLDDRDLPGDVLLVLDAGCDQLVVGRVFRLMLRRARPPSS